MASTEFEMGHHMHRGIGMGLGGGGGRLLPFSSAAPQQPDVLYGPSCPLWVCLWIPIERRIMATLGQSEPKTTTVQSMSAFGP